MLLDEQALAHAAPIDEAQALFEEARRRTRRRRLRGAVAAACVLAIAGVALLLSDSGDSGIVTETRARPFVDVRAFSHEGELAFVSRGSLWVLDGATGSLREVAAGTSTSSAPWFAGFVTPSSRPQRVLPGSPVFSHDGRWLAYLVSSNANGPSASELWLAHGDGAGAHAVARLGVDQLVGWSRSRDVLAVVSDTKIEVHWIPGGVGPDWLPTALTLVTPDGATRRLFAVPAPASRTEDGTRIEAASWSPDGSEVAISTTGKVSSIVRAYRLNGGAPTTWFSIRASQRLPGVCSRGCSGTDTIADLAGWWSDWGIAFWAFDSGAIHNADDTKLELLSAPGATPHIIGQTLSDGTTDAIAAGAGDELAIVSSSAGREIGAGKTVETCSPATRSCSEVPGATVWTAANPQKHCPVACRLFNVPRSGALGSAVSLDPSWSPNGSLLAYVKAPVALTYGWPTLAWYDTHELYLLDTRTGRTTRLAEVAGAAVPTWSRDGRDLLYADGNGLWLTPRRGGRPTEIEYPLFPQADWGALPGTGTEAGTTVFYYGQVPWTAQFSWWSP